MQYWKTDSDTRTSPYGRHGHGTKYVTFEPDNGGFNNVRMAFETVAVFAHATGRVLVMPPRQRLYLLKQSHESNPQAYHSIGAFIDLKALGGALEIIDSPEFVRRERNGLLAGVANVDSLLRLAVAATRSGERQHRKQWREWQRAAATLTPAWDPLREALLFGPCNATDPPWRLATAPNFLGKRRARAVDERLADFAANASFGYRIFTHWYTFFLFADGPTDAYYKRFARDRLRYTDDIVCAAGRVVRRIGRASYSAVHIRRGELQYVSVRLGAEAWATALAGWLTQGETLFVLSDETDRSWFAPLVRAGYNLYFLADFEDVLPHGFDPNARGMVEQLVAAAPPARTFTGTFFSTFSSFVARLRAYYGHPTTSFYYAAPPEKQFIMHSTPADPDYLRVHYPYYNREWPLGWHAIHEVAPNPSRDDPSLARLPTYVPYDDLPRLRQRYPSARVQAAKRAKERPRKLP